MEASSLRATRNKSFSVSVSRIISETVIARKRVSNVRRDDLSSDDESYPPPSYETAMKMKIVRMTSDVTSSVTSDTDVGFRCCAGQFRDDFSSVSTSSTYISSSDGTVIGDTTPCRHPLTVVQDGTGVVHHVGKETIL